MGQCPISLKTDLPEEDDTFPLDTPQAFESGDMEVPSFLYGTHYSNIGSVVFYLLRLEPFTSMHLELQVRLMPPPHV